MTDDYSNNLQQLVELFPDVDREVLDAVLRSNAGLVEPSINAVLSMTDPEYKPEEPQQMQDPNMTMQDAEYAHQVAQHDMNRAQSWTSGGPPGQRHAKKPSKIRNIFKLGSKKHASPPPRPQPTTPQTTLPPPVPQRRQLDSDFSESSDDDSQPIQTQPAAQPPQDAAAASNQYRQSKPAETAMAPGPNVFNLIDDSTDISSPAGNLASYAPLNPTKYSPSPQPKELPKLTSTEMEFASAFGAGAGDPFDMRGQSQPLPAANTGSASPAVDMSNPFEVAGPVGNTAAVPVTSEIAAGDETNPFRKLHH